MTDMLKAALKAGIEHIYDEFEIGFRPVYTHNADTRHRLSAVVGSAPSCWMARRRGWAIHCRRAQTSALWDSRTFSSLPPDPGNRASLRRD